MVHHQTNHLSIQKVIEAHLTMEIIKIQQRALLEPNCTVEYLKNDIV